MAQSTRDFPGTIDRGAAARGRIIDVWEAQDTLNSGPTAPASPVAYMLWADTTASQLKQRNGANNAWVTLAPLVAGLLPLSGGTLTGFATLHADPTSALHAATKQYVDARTSANRQVFTSSGTWTKPTGYAADTLVLIEAWGAGGGGSTAGGNDGGGGGGGAYAHRFMRLGDVGATETVTIGSGGAAGATGGVGGTGSFGNFVYAFGGGGGANGFGGGGGGVLSAGQSGDVAIVRGQGGQPANQGLRNSSLGGGAGQNAPDINGNPIDTPGVSGDGGGGGGSGASGAGGQSNRGGGGGGSGAAGAGGASTHGGAGGTAGTNNATAPGGGGGRGEPGARGEVRVTVIA